MKVEIGGQEKLHLIVKRDLEISSLVFFWDGVEKVMENATQVSVGRKDGIDFNSEILGIDFVGKSGSDFQGGRGC